MLTIFTNTFARPDYVQLLAWSLRATVREPYRFVVVVQPGGLRREWDAVDEVRDGSSQGLFAVLDIAPMIDGPSVILRDDCVPVLPWDRSVFPNPSCSRFGRHTLFYREEPGLHGSPVLQASIVSAAADCPAAWPAELCAAAAAAHAEEILGGVFLHLVKGTVAAPDCPANEAKPRLVAAVAAHLGIAAPQPLTAAERAVHPGAAFPAPAASGPRRPSPGLGDMVAAGLSAVGITKERAQAVASAVGIKDCGCAQRQAALNALGHRIGIGEPPNGEAQSD